MYEFTLPNDKRPPLASIPKEHSLLRGMTHYDARGGKMTEIYYDKCIDIFPEGRDFPCRFLSLGDKTYFIRYDPDMRVRDCRLWQKDSFYAPRRDVIRHMTPDKLLAQPEQTEIEWWWLNEPLPGPFGFGFMANTNKPYAFWFPVIKGWVQQEFYDYTSEEPESDVFALPVECQ